MGQWTTKLVTLRKDLAKAIRERHGKAVVINGARWLDGRYLWNYNKTERYRRAEMFAQAPGYQRTRFEVTVWMDGTFHARALPT